MEKQSSSIHPTAVIHPMALVDPSAKVGANAYIGPFCVVGPNVVLGDSVRLISHVAVDGITTIGEGCEIYPFASIGHAPQDLKYKGEPSTVTIGANTRIREYVTIQPGTEGGGMKTVVGDNCLLMVGVHVAHDCFVGNNVVMANYATLAGHVHVADHVIIGGLSAIQQFVRIGVHAIIGGMSGVEKDVVPYAMVMGERAHLHGINLVGLRRHGFPNAVIHQIQGIYKDIFTEDADVPFNTRVEGQREKLGLKKGQPTSIADPSVDTFFNFIDGDTKRSFCMPKGR